AAAGCIQLSEKSVAKYLKSNVALMKKMIKDGYSDPNTLKNRIKAVEGWLKKPTLLKAEKSVAKYLKSNVALMKKMIKDGYSDPNTLKNRIKAVEGWLKKPSLLKADKGADYAAVIEINLADIKEPILACPNDPDDVKLLSEVKGTKIQDVFLGSCMTNIGHFRAAAEIWRGSKFNPDVRTWICPPTRMDQAQLKDEAYFSVYSAFGARIEIAGCSLCMGNQARVPDGVNMFSTSTRNFDDRIGNGAK